MCGAFHAAGVTNTEDCYDEWTSSTLVRITNTFLTNDEFQGGDRCWARIEPARPWMDPSEERINLSLPTETSVVVEVGCT